MAAESLKEYLIKLGWDVNEKGFSNAFKKMEDFEGKANKLTTRLSRSMVAAGSAVFSIISSATIATGKLLGNVAEADLATERFARRMWTTEERARSFLSALDAMDASYEDIFWMTPEEYERFMSLKDFASGLQAPAELNDTLKLIRDIQFEFSRLKTIINYGTQWVTYYLGKYLGDDLTKLRNKFKSLNDYIAAHLPQIAEKVAKFLSVLVKLASTAIKFGGQLLSILDRLWNKLSSGSKAVVGFGAAIMGLLKMGPLGLFIGALTMILLLLEDFYGWQEGKESALPGFWEKISKWKEDFKNTGELDDFISKMDHLGESVFNVVKGFGDIAAGVIGWAEDAGVLKLAWDGFLGTIQFVATTLQGIADILTAISGDVSNLPENSMIATKQVYNEKTGEYETKADLYNTAANIGDKLLEGMGTTADDIVAFLGDFFLGPELRHELLPHLDSYDKSYWDSAAATAGGFGGSRGGSFGGTRGGGFNGTINMTVNAAPGQSEEDIAKIAADRIVDNIKKNNPVR